MRAYETIFPLCGIFDGFFVLLYFGILQEISSFGVTRPFSNIMAPLTLFNEAPKRKGVAPQAPKNAYLWLRATLGNYIKDPKEWKIND